MALEPRKILIWGKTRPELSKTHKETVCTGGVFADTRCFVRLYPIPLRYLDDERVFQKYQWIEAKVSKSTKDYRPESYNILCDDITVGTHIPPDGNWRDRAEWITQPPGHVFQSVEALQAARESSGTSIGMVKPREVLDIRAEPYSPQERQEFWTKHQAILAQQEIQFTEEPGRQVRPLPPPSFRFQIRFRCDDPACASGHTYTVFDWEVDALYNRLCERAGCEGARDQVIAKLRDDVCGQEKDTHFFLGNMLAHPQVFTIVGLWYPKRQAHQQPSLFAGNDPRW